MSGPPKLTFGLIDTYGLVMITTIYVWMYSKDILKILEFKYFEKEQISFIWSKFEKVMKNISLITYKG